MERHSLIAPKRLNRPLPASAALRLFKVEAGINGLLPTSWAPPIYFRFSLEKLRFALGGNRLLRLQLLARSSLTAANPKIAPTNRKPVRGLDNVGFIAASRLTLPGNQQAGHGLLTHKYGVLLQTPIRRNVSFAETIKPELGEKNVGVEIFRAQGPRWIGFERYLRGLSIERKPEFSRLALDPCLRLRPVFALLGKLNIESTVPKLPRPVCQFNHPDIRDATCRTISAIGA